MDPDSGPVAADAREADPLVTYSSIQVDPDRPGCLRVQVSGPPAAVADHLRRHADLLAPSPGAETRDGVCPACAGAMPAHTMSAPLQASHVEHLSAARAAAADPPTPEEARGAIADVLASWGVRSMHGEWTDREAQLSAARDVLAALPPVAGPEARWQGSWDHCYEDMGDDPCGATPVAARGDEEGALYPVCAAHVPVAGPEVRPDETLRALSEAATPGPWKAAHLIGRVVITHEDADLIATAVNHVRALLAAAPASAPGDEGLRAENVEIERLRKRLVAVEAERDDAAGGYRVTREAVDRFRDVLADALGHADENPGDDALLAQVREHFGRTGPEPTRWRDFVAGGRAAVDQINAERRALASPAPSEPRGLHGCPDPACWYAPHTGDHAYAPPPRSTGPLP